ncbi:DUF1638 domain-containing protein [Prosthecodimorpha hirschii]|uniref:DUF1638 domain-containing protein n=1 Tax=Prosthecodimorpha hirschii TaxID=665126 RepID=UPI001FEEBA59|nr:DUF1638 domain-containing protein [Prosthecomicrobium hirschii]
MTDDGDDDRKPDDGAAGAGRVTAGRRRGGRAAAMDRATRTVSPAWPAATNHASAASPGRDTAAPVAAACKPSPSTRPAVDRSARTLVIGCGAVVREAMAALRLAGLEHVDVVGIPAKLHNRPEKIPDAVRCRIASARIRDGYGRILVAYGDCGTGGELDRMLAAEGVERIAGDHCYAFFAGIDDFAALHDADPATFYLTDYLARHFDSLVWRGLGLDRHPDLLSAYFGNYTRLIYLAQMPDPILEADARAAARRLGLAFEMRTTGLGGLSDWIAAKA